MEQSEMIEDNGFENFEDQEKYKSITLAKQKKADLCARMAVLFLMISFCVLEIGDLIQGNEVCGNVMEIKIRQSDLLSIILYVVSGCFACIGFRIKKTHLTKAMFIFTIILPVSILISAVLMFAILYFLSYPLIQLAW